MGVSSTLDSSAIFLFSSRLFFAVLMGNRQPYPESGLLFNKPLTYVAELLDSAGLGALGVVLVISIMDEKRRVVIATPP